MKKTRKNISIIALILAGAIPSLFLSCNENENFPIQEKPISEQAIKKIAEELQVGVPEVNLEEVAGQPFVIFTLWRRDNQNHCTRFGICEWFPDFDFDLNDLPERHVPCYFLLDSAQKLKPFIVELKEDVSNLPQEAYEFGVTYDIVISTEAINSIGFEEVIVRAGVYPYNPEIGEFGGYVIPLDGVISK